MSNLRRYWLDSDKNCGINCSIKIEVTNESFEITDLQGCHTKMSLDEWNELKSKIKQDESIPQDFKDSLCFSPYENYGFLKAVLNDEIQ